MEERNCEQLEKIGSPIGHLLLLTSAWACPYAHILHRLA